MKPKTKEELIAEAKILLQEEQKAKGEAFMKEIQSVCEKHGMDLVAEGLLRIQPRIKK